MSLNIDNALLYKAAKIASVNQKKGVKALLDAFAAHGDGDARKLAYILGTARHETDGKFQPIREYGLGKGRAYGRPDAVTKQTYYGRGFVQLTWKANYQRVLDELGVDAVANPDLVMALGTSASIAVLGMMKGWFTGKKLGDYFNKSVADWENARRIINGMDRAALVAGYARQYHAAILAATKATPQSIVSLASMPTDSPPVAPHKSQLNQIGVGTIATGAVAAGQAALQSANTVTDQVQTVVSNASGAIETTTQTVQVIKENHDTWTGWLGSVFTPTVGIATGVIIVALGLGVLFYRWRIRSRYGV